MASSIFNICSCFLYFTELTWLQNKIENNPLHCCLDCYWCILLEYTRCCDVFFMVSNARGTGTWTNVKFPPTWDLIRVKCPGVTRGWWAFLDLTHTLWRILKIGVSCESNSFKKSRIFVWGVFKIEFFLPRSGMRGSQAKSGRVLTKRGPPFWTPNLDPFPDPILDP